MIKPGIIQQKARNVGVRDQQIEKDYVLSWILQGIAQHNELSKSMVFKGGTVLKKVYFENYRFSEDLDFKLLDDALTKDQIIGYFTETFEYIREEANIPLEIADNNEYEGSGINIYISYVGPLGGKGVNKRVKVDVSKSEKLEFKAKIKNVVLGYPDQEDHKLLCYSLEEVLIEKMRSIMQRMQARDFYDLWYLLEVHEMEIEFYTNEFIAKCESKEVDPKQFLVKLEQRKAGYRGRWQKSMCSQIKDLPDFDKVERELQRHIKKIAL
ncbi:MAG: nucleotidyl transferase AbiEii/AbiGii toxin family protein [Fibrobacteria bacterium]|nr:nucleotidyl transferase AbiEii/AbiGii toxin family protein [Fibrobacteria bacterium]